MGYGVYTSHVNLRRKCGTTTSRSDTFDCSSCCFFQPQIPVQPYMVKSLTEDAAVQFGYFKSVNQFLQVGSAISVDNCDFHLQLTSSSTWRGLRLELSRMRIASP